MLFVRGSLNSELSNPRRGPVLNEISNLFGEGYTLTRAGRNRGIVFASWLKGIVAVVNELQVEPKVRPPAAQKSVADGPTQ